MSTKETGIGADISALAKEQLQKLSLADVKLAPEAGVTSNAQAEEPAAHAYAPAPNEMEAAIGVIARLLSGQDVTGDDPELEQAKRMKADAIDDLQNAIATASGDEKANLQAALDRVRGAKSPDAIRAAIVDAHKAMAAAAAGSEKPETPEQKVERLWTEMKELNHAAEKDFNALDKYTTEEEKEKRKELQDQIDNEKDPEKKAALQKQLLQLDKQVAQRVLKEAPADSPEYKHAGDLLKKTTKREETTAEIANTIHKSTPRAKGSEVTAKEEASLTIQESAPNPSIPVTNVASADLGTLAPQTTNGSPKAPDQSVNLIG